MPNKGSELSWEISFPLLTNPNIIMAWFKAMGATYLLCITVLSLVFIAMGEPEGLPAMLFIFLIIILGITGLGLLIMLIVLGNRSNARFSLSDKTVRYECTDKRITFLSKMAVAAGGFTGNPTTAGAGLLSASRRIVEVEWSGITNAVYDQKNHTIRLQSRYRDLLHLYCPSNEFERIRRIVQSNLTQQNNRPVPPKTNTSILKIASSSVLIILISLPLFALKEIVALPVIIPLMVMLFSLVVVLAVPLFGWGVLCLEGLLFFYLGSGLLELREVKLVSTYRFRGYETLDAVEWVVLALGVLCMVGLGMVSINALKGKFSPLLMRE